MSARGGTRGPVLDWLRISMVASEVLGDQTDPEAMLSRPASNRHFLGIDPSQTTLPPDPSRMSGSDVSRSRSRSSGGTAPIFRRLGPGRGPEPRPRRPSLKPGRSPAPSRRWASRTRHGVEWRWIEHGGWDPQKWASRPTEVSKESHDGFLESPLGGRFRIPHGRGGGWSSRRFRSNEAATWASGRCRAASRRPSGWTGRTWRHGTTVEPRRWG